MTAKQEEELKRICGTLRDIASTFPASSPEVNAIRTSAFALQIVFLKGLTNDLEDLAADRELNSTERAKLKELGIEL